jgi:hypothetical protein
MIWTEERTAAARAACQKWAGTPHRNRVAVAGYTGGVDCLRFVFEVVIAAGILPRFSLPSYNERLGILRDRNVMEPIMMEYAHCEAVDVGSRFVAPEFGDVAIFSCGPQSNHTGIVIDGEVWHVPGRGRVGPEAWINVAPKLQRLMRFTGTGFAQDIKSLTWEKIRASL